MAIDFSPERWERVKQNARLWWEGRLGRPLIQVYCSGHDPGRPEPKLPAKIATSHYDFSVSPEAIVDRWEYDLSSTSYLGDAFPEIIPNFGPGILAAFLGAHVENTEDTTWFRPPESRPITDLDLSYHADNTWLQRVKSILHAAANRFEGRVQVGMTDLGGVLDVLATFRPSEALLLDLYDHPADVERLTWRIHDLWWRAFNDLDDVVRSCNPGYTCWTPLFSETPYYMLQCDMCYMISPSMFDRFVKPELAASCARLGHAFYHLDGPGQLPHVESLLTIADLKGVQYVPTFQARDATHYPDLYRSLHRAGKRIQIFDIYSNLGLDLLDVLARQIGTGDSLAIIARTGAGDMDRIRRFLRDHGAD